MSGKSPAVMAAALEAKTKAEKAALRTNPKVAAVIAELQAERLAQQGIDGAALLDELL
jgi:ribosomal protein L18